MAHIATHPRTGSISNTNIFATVPGFGRGEITMLNRSQVCVSFENDHCWFDVDDMTGWNIENAVGLARWYDRVNR